MEEIKLPATVTQLQAEIEAAENIQKKYAVLMRALNADPPKVKNMNEELKKNGGKASRATDYDYVPIEIVEETLRQIFFGQYDIEIKSHKRELNSYIVEVRLHYMNPVTNTMRFVDGIGAKAMQQDSGSKISEFNDTIKQNALELGAPIAYSRAIKNATKKLGKVFGASLNRDEELDQVKVWKAKGKDEKRAELSLLFTKHAGSLNAEMCDRIREAINNMEYQTYDKLITELKQLEDEKTD